MTPDAQGPGPDDIPTPPARTRWSDDPAEDDPGLMPPFIPGRGGGPADEAAALEPERPAGEQAASDETLPGAEEPAAPEPEPFPFEGGLAGESEEAPSPEAEAFPFEDGLAGETEEAPPSEAEAFPFEGGATGWTDEDASVETPPEPGEAEEEEAFWDAGPAGVEPEDFPMHAFDLGQEEPAEPEAPIEEEPAPGEMFAELEPESADGPEGPAAAPGDASHLADRLEWLAQSLRTEGAAALNRELTDGDRVTSLLAGVLAGYLAGREDPSEGR